VHPPFLLFPPRGLCIFNQRQRSCGKRKGAQQTLTQTAHSTTKLISYESYHEHISTWSVFSLALHCMFVPKCDIPAAEVSIQGKKDIPLHSFPPSFSSVLCRWQPNRPPRSKPERFSSHSRLLDILSSKFARFIPDILPFTELGDHLFGLCTLACILTRGKSDPRRIFVWFFLKIDHQGFCWLFRA
jgi:hypothetical protein